jgi:general secretion pathway protein E
LAPPRGPEEASVWLARAIEWAVAHDATDLHLFPGQGEAMLWARVDGALREVARYSMTTHERMVARLKVLGRCTDYDGELIQEGRFSLNGRSEDGEARLSVLPTLRGEKAVVRLIVGGERALRLEDLGFGPALMAALRAAVERPQGLLLAIGPSGCGKSTALYALLRDLAERSPGPLSILTIEDPVEQALPFAAQIGVDPARGLSIADGLRALLRQDPEVIMIGEIRDAETAATALQAALTGHRLLSSMHATAPAEALTRLRQMGAPAYVIASALAGTLGTRLARLACPACRRMRAPTADERRRLPELADGDLVAEAPGCAECVGTGRRGRIGLGEWIAPTPATADALGRAAAAAEVARTLEPVAGAREDLLALIRQGRLAPDEAERIVGLVTLAPPQEAAR